MLEKTFRAVVLAALCLALTAIAWPASANPAGPRAVIIEPGDGDVVTSLPMSVKVMVSHPDGVYRDTLSARVDDITLNASSWDSINPNSVTSEAIVYTVSIMAELGGSPDGTHIFEVNDAFSAGAVSEGLANGPVRVSFTVDTTPPAVLRMLPASGTTVETLSPLVEIHFSEPIDPTSLPGSAGNPGFSFSIAGKSLTGNSGWSADGTILTFRPDPSVSLGLAAEATVTVTVKGLRDLAGLPMASSFIQTFRIKPVTLVPPDLAASWPDDGQTEVDINSAISIRFTRPVNKDTILSRVSMMSGARNYSYPGLLVSNDVADPYLFVFRLDTSVSPMQAGTVHTVVVDRGIMTTDGASMQSSKSFTFTTGPAPIPPATNLILLSFNPGTGQLVRTLRPTLSFRFNREVDSSSVATGLTLSDGALVSGTIGLTDDSKGILFTPSSSLAPNRTYRWTLDGIVDLKGTGMAVPVSDTFKTGDLPRVIQTTPAGGATGVDLFEPVTITFNTGLDSSTVNDLSVKVKKGAVPVRIQELQVSGTAVSFKIYEAGKTEYRGATFTVEIDRTLADLFGNTIGTPVSFSFTASGDGVKPTVVSVDPPAGTQGVGLRPEIIIEFSETMTIASVESAFTLSWTSSSSNRTLTSVDGAVSWTSGDRIMKFTPSIDIPSGAAVTVTLASTARDLAGNGLDDSGDGGAGGESFIFGFSVVDYSPVRLVTSNPPSGSTGVQPLAPVSFTFDKPVLLSTVVSGLRATDSSGRPIRGVVSSVDNGIGIVFSPSEPIIPGMVTLVIPSGTSGVHDAVGNGFDGNGDGVAGGSPGDDYTHTFTVRSAPRVVSTQPVHGESQVRRDIKVPVEILFDTPMNGKSFASTTVTATVGTEAALTDILGLDPAGTKLKLEIFLGTRANLDEETVTVRIDGSVVDIYGVPMGTDHDFTFVINNPDRPLVLESGVEPANHAQHVITRPTITIPFSEEMDRVSVETAFDLKPTNAGQYIGKSGIFSWSADGTVMRFVPAVALIQGITYEITLEDTATDLAGARLQVPMSMTFRTTDDVAPSLVTAIPVDGTVDVPIDARLTLIFSKPMDINTLGSIVISSDREVKIDRIDPDPDSDNRYIIIPETLLANKEYTVTIPRTVQDSRGNQLDMKYVTRFTTTGIGDFLEIGAMVLPGVRDRALILVQSNTSIGDSLTVKVQQRGAPASVLVSMKPVKSPRSGSYVYKGIYQVLPDPGFFGAADISVSARIGGVLNVKTAQFVVKE